MVKGRLVTALTRNKIDTLPKVSSILWYVGHTEVLF